MDQPVHASPPVQTEQNRVETVATVYRQSCLLFAAIDLGLWDYFESRGEPVAVADLAGAVGVDPDRLEVLLNCLCQINVVEIDSAGRVSSALIHALRGQNARSAVVNYRDELKDWLRLAERLRRPETEFRESRTFATDEIGPYLDMVKLSNSARAPLHVDVMCDKAGPVSRVLDVGGGHGLYTELLLRRYPGAEATILDLPAAIGYLRERFPEDLHARLTLQEGDARETVVAGAFDLVMINDVLHSFAHAEKRRIVDNAIQALKPGGRLVCCKYYLDAHDPHSAMNNHGFSLKMVLNSANGYLESNQEVEEIMRGHGLVDVETVLVRHDAPTVVQVGTRT